MILVRRLSSTEFGIDLKGQALGMQQAYCFKWPRRCGERPWLETEAELLRTWGRAGLAGGPSITDAGAEGSAMGGQPVSTTAGFGMPIDKGSLAVSIALDVSI